MRRKVIQLAGKTFVISLPSKWAKKNNIQKGQELEVVESERSLAINSGQNVVGTRCCLDVSGMNSSLIWHFLTSAYIKGIEEIELRFDSVEIFNPRTKHRVNAIMFVADTVSSLVGMELVKHGNNFCIIKEVSSAKADEFSTMLKRLFFNVCNFSSDCLSSIKNKDWIALENANYIENNVNRLFAFCLRLLNKGVCEKESDTRAYFVLISNLEEIADAFSLINKFLLSKPQKEKSLKDFMLIFEKCDFVLHESYKLFYDFEKSKCVIFYDACKDLKNSIDSVLFHSEQAILMRQFSFIEDKLMSVLSARISMSI